MCEVSDSGCRAFSPQAADAQQQANSIVDDFWCSTIARIEVTSLKEQYCMPTRPVLL
jgi:hypothetical protein